MCSTIFHGKTPVLHLKTTIFHAKTIMFHGKTLSFLRLQKMPPALNCTVHTDSTSGTRRLNSSKHPQEPLAERPRGVLKKKCMENHGWLVVLTCFNHLEKYESMGRIIRLSHIRNIWLVGATYPSEKSWSSSVGMMTFPTEWKVI